MRKTTIVHGSIEPTPLPGFRVIAPLPPEVDEYCPAFAELPGRLQPAWRLLWLSLREETRLLILRVAQAPLGEKEIMP